MGTVALDKVREKLHHAAEQCEMYRPQDCAERLRLDRLVRKKKGGVVRELPGAYLLEEDWNAFDKGERYEAKIRTLAKMHPDWVFCAASAARIRGYSLTWEKLKKVHVIAGPSHRHDTDNIQYHRIKDFRTEVVNGVKVVDAERAVFDCIRTWSAPDGLAVVDSATRKESWRDDHMYFWVKQLRENKHRFHGSLRAELVASYADARAESGGESILRMNLLIAGFELPELQVEVVGPADDGTVHRVDMNWLDGAGALIFGESDGSQKSLDPKMLKGKTTAEALIQERMRESRISAVEAKVLRVPYNVARKPEKLTKLLDDFGVPKRRNPNKLLPRKPQPMVRQGNTRLVSDGRSWLMSSTYIGINKDGKPNGCMRRCDYEDEICAIQRELDIVPY